MVVKCLFKQLLAGVEYLHKSDIIHRFVYSIFLLTCKGPQNIESPFKYTRDSENWFQLPL
jgi:serine/threonine protein kinase